VRGSKRRLLIVAALVIVAVSVGGAFHYYEAKRMKALLGRITVTQGTDKDLTGNAMIQWQGWPDGKGHVLYWAENRKGTWLLVEVPGWRVVSEVMGAPCVFWGHGGKAITWISHRHEGVQLLRGVPIICNLPLVRQRPDTYDLLEIDLERSAVRPLSEKLTHENRLDILAPRVMGFWGLTGAPPSIALPETTLCNGKRLIVERSPVVGSGMPPQQTARFFIKDLSSGSMRKVFETNALILADPIFLDDDTIIYSADGGPYRLTISTGKTESLARPGGPAMKWRIFA